MKRRDPSSDMEFLRRRLYLAAQEYEAMERVVEAARHVEQTKDFARLRMSLTRLEIAKRVRKSEACNLTSSENENHE